MSKDTLFICGLTLIGFTGLGALMLGNIRDLSELRVEMRGEIRGLRSEVRGDISELRAEGRARSEQIKELQQRMARIEGLLEGLRPNLASAASSD